MPLGTSRAARSRTMSPKRSPGNHPVMKAAPNCLNRTRIRGGSPPFEALITEAERRGHGAHLDDRTGDPESSITVKGHQFAVSVREKDSVLRVVLPSEYSGRRDPKYGASWQWQVHRQSARSYNEEWLGFLQAPRTHEEIIEFGRQLAFRYGLETFF
jgi:hypothetical protein